MQEGARRMDGRWGGELRGFRRAGWGCHCYPWYPSPSPAKTHAVPEDWEQGVVLRATYLEVTK